MKSKTINILSGQMNLDKDPRLIEPQKEYTYANNFRNNNANDGSDGTGGNIKGNTLIGVSQPDGINQVIGTVSYDKENATIYFVYNSTGKHQIRILKDNAITVLLEKSFLNFDPSYPIKAKISGDDLIWTDGLNDVRILNIEYLRNYAYYMVYVTNIYEDTQTGIINEVIQDSYELQSTFIGKCITFNDGKAYYNYYDGVNPFSRPEEIGDILPTYREITNDTLKFIAQPPNNILYADYRTVPEIIINNLFQNQYKFAYRYVYLDGRKSVWSTHSLLPPPLYNENNGIIVDQDANNAIYLQFVLDRRDVKRIEFAAVKNNNADAMIIDTFDVYDEKGNINNNDSDKFSTIWFDGSSIGYTYFQDDTTYPTEAATSFNRLYDYVPQTAKNLELINSRVLLENINEGFNLPIADAEIEVKEVAANIDDTVTYTGTCTNATVDADRNPGFFLLHGSKVEKYTFDPEIRGATLEFHIEFDVDGDTVLSKDYEFLHKANETLNDFIYRVALDVNKELKEKAKVYGVGNYETVFSNPDGTIEVPKGDVKYIKPIPKEAVFQFISDGYLMKFTNSGIPVYEDFTITLSAFNYEKLAITLGVSSLKSNSKYILGVKYKDAEFRESGVQKLGYVDVPALGSTAAWSDGTNNTIYQKRYIECVINHLPPENADYYCYVISRDNKISNYVQTIIKTAPTTSGANYVIKINEAIEDLIDENENCVIPTWSYVKGDRVRAIAQHHDAVPSPAADEYTDYELLFDTEIIGYNETNQEITIPPPTNVPVVGMILELYRPKKVAEEDDQTYFEIGFDYPIIDGYHTGNIKDQTDWVGAKSRLDFGDAYLILRRFLTSPAAFSVCESKNISDYFTSNMKAYGRPSFIVDNMKNKTYESMMRYGGVKNEGTESNYINKFSYEDYEYLPEQFGEIAGAVFSSGNVSVYQASKKTTFYVEQSIIKQSNGTDIYTVSDKVLNNKHVSAYDYGTINPESIVKVNNYVYFFDAVNGCFVRDADNGLYPVSDYGINKFSKLLGAAVLEHGVKVNGSYDEYNKEVVWSFNWENNYGYGISFIEDGNKWKSFQDYYYETVGTKEKVFVSLLGTYVNKLVSYVNGDVYIHDSNVLYNYLYGRNVTTTVEVVGNDELLEDKVFDYLTVESDDYWTADQKTFTGSVVSDSDVSVDNGDMLSVIPVMRKKENNYVAEFGRDFLTPMTVPPSFTTNPTKAAYKYVNGRRLRGKFIKVRLRNSSTNKVKIFSVIINSTISERK